MAITMKELTALKKEFKTLEKKMEKLLKAAGSAGQAKKSSKAKAAKAKPTQKAPAKKAPAKKTAAKKTAVAKTSAKKAAAGKMTGLATATDEILKIIKRAKNGVDVPTLKKKTGFDDKKVRNIVFRAAKEGRIKKSGRGVYVGS
jgi:cell division septum initiation protein DivIVA